eukprot:8973234-Pyramimonas_sp.AAC.1
MSPRTSITITARVSRMEGGRLSNFGSRLSAAHIRLRKLQELHGWRAGGCQNVALAFAPRAF